MEESKGVGRHAVAKAPVIHAPDEPLHGGPETVSDKALHTPFYNYYATPVDASKNVDRYASRPLPATPLSTVKMADRPSTSGGSGSKKTAKNEFNFDKRVSRDDFHLGAKVYGGTRSGPSAPFWGQTPTPEVSPKTVSIQQFASRTNNWESTTNPMVEPRDVGIGVALGSPTHASNFSKNRNMQSTTRLRKESRSATPPPVSRSSSVDTFDMPISKKPTGKWKLFNLFAKKQSDQSVPAISISDPNGLHGTNRPEEEIVVTSQAPPPSNSKNPARSNTTTSSRKAARHKPIIVRSQTMPVSAQVDRDDAKWRAGKKQGGGDLGRIPIALDTGHESSPASKPLLNVEIPDVRLERYSVMFDGVLKSNPSLLSRRQATVPKLKRIDDAVEREEEEKLNGVSRRATSPQPATKPSGFGLFPTSRQGHNLHIPPKLSPRHRSNTSPAFLPSPSKATFDHTTLGHQRPSIEETSSLKHPRHPSPLPPHHERPGIAITTHSNVVERERTPSPPRFSNDQSNLILDSPGETESENEATTTRNAWKPTAYHPPPEPKWQMISPSQKTPSTASSHASSYRKRSPSLASSSHTHLTRASEDSDDASAYLKGGAKMTPVEISIARQISVSRQQRKLLQPLHTGMPPLPPPPPVAARRPSHATSPARTSPMAAVAVSESGRIAETKTSTPTLVHPPNLLDPQQFAQHRRSERIVLEDA
ncbi:hypothetical protein F4678DRAFT_471699 [Xylaria arbuscula]|nr:hypothetical protein F4678DRAFT_471699 [Xylaria arbuscula]